MRLAIVVPCFNEEKMLEPAEGASCLFVAAVDKELRQWVAGGNTFSFVFVDDGSIDLTLAHLRRLSKADKRIRYVSLSRNFGKEGALYAGLEKALALESDFIITMDVDLQDPPSLIPQMLSIVESGEAESVAARRVSRKGEPPVRSFFARLFYKIINRISSTEIVDGSRDFRLMPRKMVQALVSMKEVNRFSKGLFSWVGFRTSWIEYENVERARGETKWNFWKLFKYSIDGIVSFSTAPLSLAALAGVLSCAAAFAYLVFVFVKALLFGDPVPGYPSLMCALLFLGGIQLICLGILGQYLAKTYLETKGRPIYITKEEK